MELLILLYSLISNEPERCLEHRIKALSGKGLNRKESIVKLATTKRQLYEEYSKIERQHDFNPHSWYEECTIRGRHFKETSNPFVIECTKCGGHLELQTFVLA